MRDFLIDTQTIAYWYDAGRDEHSVVLANVARLCQLSVSLEIKPRPLVSVITLGEIEWGHRDAADPDPTKQTACFKFVHEQLPGPLEVSPDAARFYGELRARLFSKYAPKPLRKKAMLPEDLIDQVTARSLGIQENDLWLCAQAVAHGMVLVTNDRMTRIREVASDLKLDLIIQNWTVPNSAAIPP
jgi:predicted nucleic acid-binding protein